MLEVPTSPLLSVFLLLMFIFLLFFPSHFVFFFIVSSFFFKFHKFICRCLFSYLFSLPILLLSFFSSCHLSPLSSTSLLVLLKFYKYSSCSSNGGFCFVVFSFVTFIFSFKPHVVTSCLFDLISF
jgi:hypothetical protein